MPFPLTGRCSRCGIGGGTWPNENDCVPVAAVPPRPRRGNCHMETRPGWPAGERKEGAGSALVLLYSVGMTKMQLHNYVHNAVRA